MKTGFLILLACGSLIGSDSVDFEKVAVMNPGDPQIKGNRIKPYAATWYVRVKNGENWKANGTLTEKAEVVASEEGEALAWTQIMAGGAMGVSFTNKTRFLRKDLRPLTSEMTITGEKVPDHMVVSMDLHFEASSLEGTLRRQGEEPAPSPSFALDVPMFDGNNMGLILAALPLKHGYETRVAVVYPRFTTSYWVVARVTGQKSFDDGRGGKVQAWVVDTDWIDRKSGHVSPGGPDASGGTYYVVPEPPEWYPHVPKYINASFDTEVIPQLLTQAGNQAGAAQQGAACKTN